MHAVHVDLDALVDDLVEFEPDVIFVRAHLEDALHLLTAFSNCLLHLL